MSTPPALSFKPPHSEELIYHCVIEHPGQPEESRIWFTGDDDDGLDDAIHHLNGCADDGVKAILTRVVCIATPIAEEFIDSTLEPEDVIGPEDA